MPLPRKTPAASFVPSDDEAIEYHWYLAVLVLSFWYLMDMFSVQVAPELVDVQILPPV